jgi:hypothetical protein
MADILTLPGERGFLMLRNRPVETELVIIHNWFEDLKRLVPN